MKIGIAGIGAVGSAVGFALDRGEIPGCHLAAISVRDDAKAAFFNSKLSAPVPTMSFEELAEACDCVIEALPPSMFEAVALPVLRAGKVLIVMSGSQLLGRGDLLDMAASFGAKIMLPSGAMLGLDALKAVAIGNIHSVTIETRKPPQSLANAPYIIRNGIDLGALTEKYLVLAGSVVEIAREFPANVNVAAALSLAGVGPERTRLEIWADPALEFNTHTVRVESDSSNFSMSIQNRPSEENPATGIITARSVIALLRQFTNVFQVGT